MPAPLMPKATALWLIENTALTFDQIATFCQLHPLEVQAIADEDITMGTIPHNPLEAGQLTAEEIVRCEKDSACHLKLTEWDDPKPRSKTSRYTPVAKRQDRPNAIAWMIKHYPDLPEASICRLLGTTRPTIKAIREKTHWNSKNIRATSPVEMGLCSHADLEKATEGYTKV